MKNFYDCKCKGINYGDNVRDFKTQEKGEVIDFYENEVIIAFPGWELQGCCGVTACELEII